MDIFDQSGLEQNKEVLSWKNKKHRSDRDTIFSIIEQDSGRSTLKQLAEILTDHPDTIGNFSMRQADYYKTLYKSGKTEMKIRPWRPEEDNILYNLIQKGVSNNKIAAILNRTRQAVCHRIIQLDFQTRISEKKASHVKEGLVKGLSHAEIAKNCNAKLSSVRHISSKYKPYVDKRRLAFPRNGSFVEREIRASLESRYGDAVLPKKSSKTWSGGRYEIDIPIVVGKYKFAIEVQSPLHKDKKFRDYAKMRCAEEKGWLWLPVWVMEVNPDIKIANKFVNLICHLINNYQKGNTHPYVRYMEIIRKKEEEEFYAPIQEPVYNKWVTYGDYWTDVEEQILKDNYGKVPKKEIRELLKNERTIVAIGHKAMQFGLTKTRKNYTPREADILRKYYPIAEKDYICSLLPDRSWTSIASKAHDLGLKRLKSPVIKETSSA